MLLEALRRNCAVGSNVASVGTFDLIYLSSFRHGAQKLGKIDGAVPVGVHSSHQSMHLALRRGLSQVVHNEGEFVCRNLSCPREGMSKPTVCSAKVTVSVLVQQTERFFEFFEFFRGNVLGTCVHLRRCR